MAILGVTLKHREEVGVMLHVGLLAERTVVILVRVEST